MFSGPHRAILVERLAQDFREAGISDAASAAIVTMMAGQELTSEQVQALARDERAVDALYEAMGIKKDGGKEQEPALHKGQEAALEAAAGDKLDIATMPRVEEEAEPEAAKPKPALHEGEAVALDGEAVPAANTQQGGENAEERGKPQKPALHEGEAVALDR